LKSEGLRMLTVLLYEVSRQSQEQFEIGDKEWYLHSGIITGRIFTEVREILRQRTAVNPKNGLLSCIIIS
jgi:hypothetical protein